MDPIRLHKFIGIQLEQHICHNSRVNCQFTIVRAVVPQIRALGSPSRVISTEDRGKEWVKHLCLACVRVCEVAILILAQANAISALPFAIKLFWINSFYCPPQFWPTSTWSEKLHMNFLLTMRSSIFVLLPLGIHLPFFALSPKENSCKVKLVFCLSYLSSNI